MVDGIHDKSSIQLPIVKELLIATNPDPDSTLAYLMRVPLGEGIVLRTAGTWPRTKALYCYPVPADEWPAEPDIVERVPLRSCVRRGAAIDIVAARFRENRSQLVFTTARGGDAVFWQSPRTRKQARPQVNLPTARAAGSPSSRSSSTPTNATPTASPASRCAPPAGACPAATTASSSTGPSSPRWNANPCPT